LIFLFLDFNISTEENIKSTMFINNHQSTTFISEDNPTFVSEEKSTFVSEEKSTGMYAYLTFTYFF
jgi:fructose-1,6-bisphosphatase